MLDADQTLQCFRFKGVGEFCISHEAFPNMSVNMVDMLRQTPGNEITEKGFLAKYYPGTDNNSFGFDFRAYVQSMRARVFLVNIASSVAITVRPELNEQR
jgi:hypothetical protein